ncbi:MAG TPA: prephenate dehydrogenase/arogenate dehydrogenase family protein [Methylomirabilota bacterium]|nr:prephenate dehydrogenase/arogenate dehydrogenase family protein [Methylomirabilota bacterium]
MIGRLSIVGLGLLGGSVAKAARAASLAQEIVGVGRNPKSLEPALRARSVDRITTDLSEGVSGADMIVLATPVATLEGQLPAVWQAASSHALLTDVGSTKAAIVKTAEALGASRPLSFVGSHPMAGSNLSGFSVARADLFSGATVILTPTDRTPSEAVKRVTEFWEAMGGRVTVMDPATHDRAVAAISHLPHLVVDALVAAVVDMDPRFLDVAGRGFKDTTRIAASDPAVWREIFQENREALGEALAAFRGALGRLEGILAAGDDAAIESALEAIRKTRAELG